MKKALSFRALFLFMFGFSLLAWHTWQGWAFSPSDLGGSLGGRGEQELVLQDSVIYDCFTALSLEASLWNFADNTPCTIQELKFYLEEIDYDTLSDSGKKCYDYIQKYFSQQIFCFGSDILKVGLEGSLGLEGYYKQNDDTNWVYDRYKKAHLIDALLSISCGNYFTMMCDLYLGNNRNKMQDDDCYLSLPLDADSIDLNFPTTAYFSTGCKITKGTGLTFQLGMAQGSIGRTMEGSIIKSEYLTGATYGLLSAYSRAVKFTTSVQQLNVDRYFYYHKLDIRLGKKFTFTALEGQLAASDMELRFLNPLTIFHGFSPWRDYSDEDDTNTCAYLAIKMVFVPIKYIRIYGAFSMTQFQTPYETNNWGDSLTPNGMGGQLGLESYIPIEKGYIHWGAEFYYAQPYLYLKPTEQASMVKAYRENIGDTKHVFYEWVGSPFGPDTIAGSAVLAYEQPAKYSIGLKYLLCVRGELAQDGIFGKWHGQVSNIEEFFKDKDGNVTDDFTHQWAGYPQTKSQRDDTTPTGTAEYTNTISIKAKYALTKATEILAQPSYSFVFNAGHIEGNKEHGFEVALGMKMRFFAKDNAL